MCVFGNVDIDIIIAYVNVLRKRTESGRQGLNLHGRLDGNYRMRAVCTEADFNRSSLTAIAYGLRRQGKTPCVPA